MYLSANQPSFFSLGFQIPPHFDLFIQQDLVTSLNLIVTSADLHKHGAENVFYLDNKTVKPAAGNVVFLARSNVLADVYAVAGMFLLSCGIQFLLY